MRREVKWFAEQREKILKENDHKGGWEQEELSYLFECLKEEVGELKGKLPKDMLFDSIQNINAVIKECGDIGNFAMMIADNAKRQEESQNERWKEREGI